MDKSVPFIVYEAEQARHERDKRRWVIVCLVLIILLFGTNAAWIAYESQFEKQTITQDVWQDAENGVNRFIGGDYYGNPESNNYDNDQNP